MIVCLKCGHQNEDGAPWCTACHTFLGWQEKSSADEPVSVLEISLPTSIATVVPGGEVTFQAKIRNGGTIVDKAILEVTGEAAAWAVVESPELALMPKQEITSVIRFRPPRSPAVRAGEIPFGVRVRSTATGSGAVTERGGTLTVDAYTDVRALIVPATSEGFEDGEHTITVQNQGNGATEVNLSVVDVADVLAFELQPAKHVIEPGGTGVSRLHVWLRKDISRPGERLQFQVVAEPVRTTAVVVDGAFRQVPKPEPIKSKGRAWLWPVGIAAGLVLALTGTAIALAAGGHGVWPWSAPLATHPGTQGPTLVAATSPTPVTPTLSSPTPASPTPVARQQRLEAEALTFNSDNPNLVSQQADCCGVHWSGGKQLWFRAVAAGEYVTVSFNVTIAATYRIDVRLTRAPDYGTCSLELDGQTVVAHYEGYVPGTVGTTVETDVVPLSAGTFLSAGTHNFTVRITGASGVGYFAGIDYLDLTPT